MIPSPWSLSVWDSPASRVSTSRVWCQRKHKQEKEIRTKSRKECFLIIADVAWRAWFESLISRVGLRAGLGWIAGGQQLDSFRETSSQKHGEPGRQRPLRWCSKALCLYLRLFGDQKTNDCLTGESWICDETSGVLFLLSWEEAWLWFVWKPDLILKIQTAMPCVLFVNARLLQDIDLMDTSQPHMSSIFISVWKVAAGTQPALPVQRVDTTSLHVLVKVSTFYF